ncbi:MAG: 16S rRNA (guanine(527)-N(7))-methyltransferase RsmG [Bacteroidetes bacterium]|nr:16S rRNA (guanine(527)-N(7))-methyltransferase RsmG [Bacteroidota bacterium]
MELLRKFLNEELNIAEESIFSKFEEYNRLLLEWNSKINLVSRKNDSIENIALNSVFFLTKFRMKPDASVLDIGTGGGFPGVPLKIIHEGISITLVDSIRKKINALSDIVARLGLTNTKAVCSRAEDLKKDKRNSFDYIVSKSVAPLSELASWGIDMLKPDGMMLCIKGGDMTMEISDLKRKIKNADTEEIPYSFDSIYNIDDKRLVIIKKQ